MTFIDRLFASLAAAALAWFIGGALNVPIWRDGWSLSKIGDRTDMAATAALLILLLTRKARA